MEPLLAARVQMAFSLGFHMIFAATGMALPLMLALAEGRWLRTGDPAARSLAQTWAKATAVLFAIGAVSGTALSFELSLLWPRFMAFAGPLIGPAFALEGYAFFIEAIFLGLYLYGWDRLRPRIHWLCVWPVVLGGAFSGIIVLATNSWMQWPTGFQLGSNGLPTDVDPVAAIFNPAFLRMTAHSTLGAYEAVGFAAAGVYAAALLGNRQPSRAHYNRLGLIIALLLAAPTAVAQPVLGDLLGKMLYESQPAKLAAMEGQFATERGAPLRIGGWPNPATRQTPGAIEIPGGLSYLAASNPDATVLGLDAFPPEYQPPAQIVHAAFQVMVGCGFLLVGVAAWFWVGWWRERRGTGAGRRHPWLWRTLILASPLGFVAIEAGWVVTEVGRQPWIIYGVMLTRNAVTPVSGVPWTLAGFAVLYGALLVTLVFLLRRLAHGQSEPVSDFGAPSHAA
jgi:cytochrome d ubiquinol oxidase subunit I